MINTYVGLILPSIANAMNQIIAMSFFQSLPNELLEAVRIDGGSELTIYLRIALPLSRLIISMPIGIPTLLSV